MQTIESIKEIISQVSYKDWTFRVDLQSGVTPFLQIVFDEPCHFTGVMEKQHCRKWMLSFHMTNSEIVLTAFKAVMGAVEHEARENFEYKGEKILQPHFDLDYMVEFAKKKRISIRPK